jgi:hypothetical protein
MGYSAVPLRNGIACAISHAVVPNQAGLAARRTPCFVRFDEQRNVPEGVAVFDGPEEVLCGLSVARGAAAAFRAGMKFLDDSAQTRFGLHRILRVRCVHELVTVVVHRDSAARAHHLVSVSHSRHPRPRKSIQGYLLTPLA